MKNPLYSVSIDEIPFSDRIIAIMIRTYLVRCADAEQKLSSVLSEGIALKFPSQPSDKELAAILLKTVLEGEQLAKLIDEAAAFVKADGTDCKDTGIDEAFAAVLEIIDNISGKSIVMNMSVELAEYITKLYYALKTNN